MRHDAIIIGGSFAGLACALYLARARRTVCVVDAGLPRNRFSAHGHGFLTQDGSNPADILRVAREQVAAYPSVTFVAGRAVAAEGASDNFRVALASGEGLEARRLVLAFGITDDLPPVPGLAERWGQSVLHCPYCHGYEFAERRLGVLYSYPMSLHQAMLVAEWGPVTLFLNGQAVEDADALAELARRGVTVEAGPVRALHGRGVELDSVELADGRHVPIQALYVGPHTRLNSDIAATLGCQMEDGMMGPILATDAMKQTTISGVVAAGDITRGAHSITWAASDGVMAAMAVHRSLVF